VFFCAASFKKSSSHKLGEAVTLKFQITQHSRNAFLMEILQKYFGCGKCYKNNSAGTVLAFSVESLSDLTEKIIPFFEKYPLQGEKVKDYEDFKKVALLMQNKAHLTREGLDEIRQIKAGMNFSRKEE